MMIYYTHISIRFLTKEKKVLDVVTDCYQLPIIAVFNQSHLDLDLHLDR
jgi:hypothetical protein